jgi:hypothetical protein
MDLKLPHLIRRCLNALCHEVKERLRRGTKPYNQSLALNVVLDLTRSKSELVLENPLLRQQLIVLQRCVKRPALTRRDLVGHREGQHCPALPESRSRVSLHNLVRHCAIQQNCFPISFKRNRCVLVA